MKEKDSAVTLSRKAVQDQESAESRGGIAMKEKDSAVTLSRKAVQDQKSAESRRDIAMKEKDSAVTLSRKAVQDQKKDRQETAYYIQKNAMDANKELLDLRKEIAWRKFKEQYKEKIKKENKEFKEVENIDKYLPWEKPEGGWSDAEKNCIREFEEEWELLGGE